MLWCLINALHQKVFSYPGIKDFSYLVFEKNTDFKRV